MSILTFEAWPDPNNGETPDGVFARTAWLPIVGPSCYLIWCTISRQLVGHKARLPDGSAMVAWSAETLARAHGLKPSEAATGPLRKSLDRLDRFGLFARPLVEGRPWLVRLAAPPLTEGQLDRSPSYVAAMQRATFGEQVTA